MEDEPTMDDNDFLTLASELIKFRHRMRMDHGEEKCDLKPMTLSQWRDELESFHRLRKRVIG